MGCNNLSQFVEGSCKVREGTKSQFVISGGIKPSHKLTEEQQYFVSDKWILLLVFIVSYRILTDNANRAFQGNVAMKVTQPCGQLWNHCK